MSLVIILFVVALLCSSTLMRRALPSESVLVPVLVGGGLLVLFQLERLG